MSTLLLPPETKLADEVQHLLSQCSPVVQAHSQRCYQFAAGFAAADGVEIDHEVLYLGTILHDVGLSPAGCGTERFEVRGANLVRDILTSYDMERDRIANVWDCIALHASTPIARNKSTETRYANRGIALDIRGVGFESLEGAHLRAVLDQWPRRSFAEDFEAVLAGEVRANPDSVRLSWLEPVACVHIPGFAPTDFLAGLRASSHFC